MFIQRWMNEEYGLSDRQIGKICCKYENKAGK